jgi:hypothetical protein
VVTREVEHDRPKVRGRSTQVRDAVAVSRQPDERLLNEVLGGVAVVDE